MKNLKKPTVTVAVSAYNESKNILQFITSVLEQNASNFVFEQLLIISDGSSDSTEKQVRKLNDKKIIFRNYKKRIGKSSRLNEIYKALTSDILIQTDADVVFGGNVISAIVKEFVKDKELGMCAGKPLPYKGNTFTDKADSLFFKLYTKYFKSVRNGSTVYCADGRILAFRKECVKKITVPETMIANDVYTYYASKSLGYKFKFVNDAIVYFRSPQTLRDKLRQTLRASAVPLRMQRYFESTLIKAESYIPLRTRISFALESLITNPIYFFYIRLIHAYCIIVAKKSEQNITATWPIAFTTKEVVKGRHKHSKVVYYRA